MKVFKKCQQEILYETPSTRVKKTRLNTKKFEIRCPNILLMHEINPININCNAVIKANYYDYN